MPAGVPVGFLYSTTYMTTLFAAAAATKCMAVVRLNKLTYA